MVPGFKHNGQSGKTVHCDRIWIPGQRSRIWNRGIFNWLFSGWQICQSPLGWLFKHPAGFIYRHYPNRYSGNISRDSQIIKKLADQQVCCRIYWTISGYSSLITTFFLVCLFLRNAAFTATGIKSILRTVSMQQGPHLRDSPGTPGLYVYGNCPDHCNYHHIFHQKMG